MIQLNPALPITTPKGPALAHFLIDYGIESDLFWVSFQDDTGECWTWNNKDIRAQKNVTAGREYISPFYNPEDVALNKVNLDSNKLEWISMQITLPYVAQYCFVKNLEKSFLGMWTGKEFMLIAGEFFLSDLWRPAFVEGGFEDMPGTRGELSFVPTGIAKDSTGAIWGRDFR